MSRRNSSESSFLVSSTQEASPASIYALKTALLTMKDRCQKLQNRLTSMEEENLQLRIERHSIPGLYKKEPDLNPDLSIMNRKIEELLTSKSKLSHHIFMVATENKDLWERLYKLTDEKYCIEHNINVDIDSKNKYTALKPLRSLQIAQVCKDGKEESLEEISLKGKSERLNSPDNQSVKLDPLKVKDCEFALTDMSEEEEMEYEDVALNQLNEVLDKLKNEKQILLQNQNDLKLALTKVTDFVNDYIPCKDCIERDKEPISEPIGIISTDEEKHKSTGELLNITNLPQNNNFEDRICPLCTKFYAKSTPFDEFNDHVLSHFVEDSDQDSHISLFENDCLIKT